MWSQQGHDKKNNADGKSEMETVTGTRLQLQYFVVLKGSSCFKVL